MSDLHDTSASEAQGEGEGTHEAAQGESSSTRARPRSRPSFTPETARKAARASAEARRARAREREAEREDAAMTVRQRLAVAMSAELSVEDWRKVVAHARDNARTADLARMADQAFGKPNPEEDEATPEDGPAMTKGERAALIARLLEEERAQRTPHGDPSDPTASA